MGNRDLLVTSVNLTRSRHGRILISYVVMIVVKDMREMWRSIILESGEKCLMAKRALVSLSSWLNGHLVPWHDLLPQLAEEVGKTIRDDLFSKPLLSLSPSACCLLFHYCFTG